MGQGREYLNAKEFPKAVINFKVAAQNMPTDAEPVYELGITYLAQGKRVDALKAFQKALRMNPKHEGAQYQLALFKVGSEKLETLDETRETLMEYLKAHPDDAFAKGALAVTEAKLGKKDEAVRLLQELGEKAPGDVRAATAVVAVFAARGDLKEAVAITRDLSTRMPKSPEAAVLRAEFSLAIGDNEDANAEITRALTLKPDFRPALQMRLRREIINKETARAEKTSQLLAKLPEKQLWSAYAGMLFVEGRIDEGMAEFERVLKAHGDPPELRNEYATMLRLAGRRKEAKAVLAGTLAKSKNNRAALLQRASLSIDDGDLVGASRDLGTLQDMKALSAEMSYEKSRICAARGETVKQGDLLLETLKLNPRFFRARADLARLLSDTGKPKEALSLLDQATPEEKALSEFAFYRVRALLAAGDVGPAEKEVAQALKSTPAPGLLYLDGLVRDRKGDLKGARASLEQALYANPGEAATLHALGTVMREQGEAQKYAALVQTLAAKYPKLAALQTELGRQLESAGDIKGARVAFEAAGASGDILTSGLALASLDMRVGALENAKKRLMDLTTSHDNGRVRLILAEVETRLGDKDNAIRNYLMALHFEPDSVVVMNNLAGFLGSQPDKLDDALFWAQKALALAPDNPVVTDTVGWTLCLQRRYAAALPYLEKSLQLKDRPVAHYHYAVALAKTGRQANGKREYNAAVKQDPNSEARSVVAPLLDIVQAR